MNKFQSVNSSDLRAVISRVIFLVSDVCLPIFTEGSSSLHVDVSFFVFNHEEFWLLIVVIRGFDTATEIVDLLDVVG